VLSSPRGQAMVRNTDLPHSPDMHRGQDGETSMIKAFVVENDRLRAVDDLLSNKERLVWIDLLAPTKEEEASVEKLIGVSIPTRDEMEEIEVSSRLYTENGSLYMTATLPANTDGDHPVMLPVSFVLAQDRLITVRYHEPRAFATFPMRAEQADVGCSSAEAILVGLLETVVDRLADVLERAGGEIIDISHDIFHPSEKRVRTRDRSFQIILRRIGRKEELVSNIQDSLLTMQRLAGFFEQTTKQVDSEGVDIRVKTLSHDLASLTAHSSSLSQKITFLLDATLGMIGIEQNGIIKIVSVAAVVFLPPTLIASIYGMNFARMPELHWTLGYPFALGLMVVSAVLPAWFFRRLGWI
jgi:magnesium transporter